MFSRNGYGVSGNPEIERMGIVVPMGGLGVTHAGSGRPYIGTTSLASYAGISIYNIDFGCRTQEQNRELRKVVERTVQELGRGGKITDTEFRNEQGFMLDMRTGLVIPYY